MSKEIKVGDWVQRRNGAQFPDGGLKRQITSIVSYIGGGGRTVAVNDVNGYGGSWAYSDLAPTQPDRRHCELIIAWAKGAEIEWLRGGDNWATIKTPVWSEYSRYRVKISPKQREINAMEIQMREMADKLAKLKEEV